MVPLATAGAGHLYEGHARSRALGLVGAATFLGMALGPFVGAFILTGFELGPAFAVAGQATSTAAAFLAPAWRWVFYLGAPLAIVVAVIVWAAAPYWRAVHGRGRLDVPGRGPVHDRPGGRPAGTDVAGHRRGPGGNGVAIAAIVTLVAERRRHRLASGARRIRSSTCTPSRDRVFSSAVLVSLLTGYALATAIVGAAVFVDRVRYGGPEEQQVALGALAGAMAIGALGLRLRRPTSGHRARQRGWPAARSRRAGDPGHGHASRRP